MDRLGIEVKLNTFMTPEMLHDLSPSPYAVFVATGSRPIVPRIPGVDKEHVCTIDDVLNGHVHFTGKKIAVIGGGLTGCETAELIASWKNVVTVIEMLPTVCHGIYASTQRETIQALNEADVKIKTNTKLLEIRDSVILLKDLQTDEELITEADHVVLSIGNRPDNQLYQAIADDMNAVLIGDALRVGKIGNATKEAFIRAYGLQ